MTRPIVIVTGSRKWFHEPTLVDALDGLKPSMIIEGGAKGADKMAAAYANRRGVPYLEVPALWDSNPGTAGPDRNRFMLRVAMRLADDAHPLIVAAFPLPSSVGTYHMIRIAEAVNIPVKLYIRQETT